MLWFLTDIDECENSSSNVCDHTCVNTVGSFLCHCRSGFILAPDQHSCIPLHNCEFVLLPPSYAAGARCGRANRLTVSVFVSQWVRRGSRTLWWARAPVPSPARIFWTWRAACCSSNWSWLTVPTSCLQGEQENFWRSPVSRVYLVLLGGLDSQVTPKYKQGSHLADQWGYGSVE